MSKSYKRYPIIKQEKVDKHIWNRKVRNGKRSKTVDSLNGANYKKVERNFDTWQYRWTLADAIESWKRYNRELTLEQWIEYWKRKCIRK